MGHDELLEEINKEIKDIAFTKFVNPLRYLQALRAVVELHKPKETKTEFQVCNYCKHIDDWKTVSLVWYPCPTIQAIEKELN